MAITVDRANDRREMLVSFDDAFLEKLATRMGRPTFRMMAPVVALGTSSVHIAKSHAMPVDLEPLEDAIIESIASLEGATDPMIPSDDQVGVYQIFFRGPSGDFIIRSSLRSE